MVIWSVVAKAKIFRFLKKIVSQSFHASFLPHFTSARNAEEMSERMLHFCERQGQQHS
jgi:hypothetical protein